jgi:hypothetical protein
VLAATSKGISLFLNLVIKSSTDAQSRAMNFCSLLFSRQAVSLVRKEKNRTEYTSSLLVSAHRGLISIKSGITVTERHSYQHSHFLEFRRAGLKN